MYNKLEHGLQLQVMKFHLPQMLHLMDTVLLGQIKQFLAIQEVQQQEILQLWVQQPLRLHQQMVEVQQSHILYINKQMLLHLIVSQQV